jgi:hypothetical protein
MSTRHITRVAVFAFLLAPLAHARATTPLVGGSDSCATPDLISGPGMFAFDNSAATTGTDGQMTGNCLFYGQNGLFQDVWFAWTSTQDGRALLSTCGQTIVDTKIAVYAGSSCPGAAPIAQACNDDMTSSGVGNLQSRLEFEVFAGNTYMVQIGTYPLATFAGTGTFTIEYVSGLVCQYDDGTTEYASEIGTGGVQRTTAWMYRMGEIGTTTRVTTVSSAWGWTMTGTPLAPGLIGEVGVWEDPNDDGDPSDAVLLGRASAPMVGAHTDALQAIALPAPVYASGYFFVAAWVEHTNGFPVPRDILGCNTRTEVGWLLGNEPGALDVNNLTANATPPFQAPNGQTYIYLLRADCQAVPTGTVFCAGDSVAPHTACPCANSSPAADGSGCLNSLGLGGKLRSVGTSSLSNDDLTLFGTQMPSSSALYFQGTTQLSGGNGNVFGDGLRCAGGSVIRLSTRANMAGVSSYPGVGDPTVSVRGMVGSPGIRTYQIWYRNAAAFCSPSTFNLTNGVEISWAP